MLCELLASLAASNRPDETRIHFLVVENNETPTLDEVIRDFRSLVPGAQIDYRIETVLGISAARNHALDYAVERGFDLLVYVDDDEFVETDWLVKLLAERDRLDLDIVGSPVRPKPISGDLTFVQRLVWSGIERSGMKSERKCRMKCNSGRGHTIKIATGSWMGRVDFFRKTGLRFDSSLGLAGGEDWNLWLKAKELGAKTGWACDAIVYETVPCERLTLSYHYRRNRDHNITEFALRHKENPQRTVRKLPLKIAGRFAKFLGTVVALPFRGGQGLVSSATALGGFVGLVQACKGARSAHYADTTGH